MDWSYRLERAIRNARPGNGYARVNGYSWMPVFYGRVKVRG